MSYTGTPCLFDNRIELLYVEDSAGDVLLTKQILSEFLQPVRLSVARDGLQALTRLADKHFRPNMIILDLSLPVLSGYEVLERNPRKDIPVIIFSASMRSSDVERTLSLGAKEYIHKPMDMVGYRNAVLGMVRTGRCLRVTHPERSRRNPGTTTPDPTGKVWIGWRGNLGWLLDLEGTNSGYSVG